MNNNAFLHDENPMNYNDFVDFIFEMGMLKRVSREGWKLISVNNPESVAEHCLRAAQIGYILATLEGYEKPEEVCSMLVFHDIGECRIGDIHKVANRYTTVNEKQAVTDQVKKLHESGRKILRFYDQIEQQNTVAGKIAKDADLLELAATAREYQKKGYLGANDWLEKTKKRIQTQTGKILLDKLINSNPDRWWKGLKQL